MALFEEILGGLQVGAGIATDIAGLFGSNNKPAGSSAKPYKDLIVTPGYTFGGGTLTRRNNDFLSGQRRLRDLTGTLQAQVKPGYGQLTETGVNAIRNRAAQESGNLRAQLAQRGLLGASFANDALARTSMDYGQLESEFRAQAFQNEMAASNALIDRTQQSLAAQAAQELSELGTSTSFLQTVNQVAVTQKEIEQKLKEMELVEKFSEPNSATPVAPAAAPAATPTATKPKKGKGLGGSPSLTGPLTGVKSRIKVRE